MGSNRILENRRERSSGTAAGEGPGFTLIELLAVIAIIAILAALVISFVLPKAQQSNFNQAKAELQMVQTAIETYHTDFGVYPPDNWPTRPTAMHFPIYTWGSSTPTPTYLPPLFYELTGAAANPGNTSFGGSKYPQITSAEYQRNFGLAGPQNSSPESLKTYLTSLRPGQSKETTPGSQVYVLTCSVGTPPSTSDPNLNPWMYNSSGPTNNPASFDLFTWIKIGTNYYEIGNF